MVVTHDARLIESTDCRLWIVDQQEVTPWEGAWRGGHGMQEPMVDLNMSFLQVSQLFVFFIILIGSGINVRSVLSASVFS